MMLKVTVSEYVVISDECTNESIMRTMYVFPGEVLWLKLYFYLNAQ
jgi:hypothetical protein